MSAGFVLFSCMLSTSHITLFHLHHKLAEKRARPATQEVPRKDLLNES